MPGLTWMVKREQETHRVRLGKFNSCNKCTACGAAAGRERWCQTDCFFRINQGWHSLIWARIHIVCGCPSNQSSSGSSSMHAARSLLCRANALLHSQHTAAAAAIHTLFFLSLACAQLSDILAARSRPLLLLLRAAYLEKSIPKPLRVTKICCHCSQAPSLIRENEISSIFTRALWVIKYLCFAIMSPLRARCSWFLKCNK